MKELILLLFFEVDAPIGLSALGLAKNQINKNRTKKSLKLILNNSPAYFLPAKNNLTFSVNHQSF